MTTNDLLKMYKWMRFTLFLTVPTAMWGLVYWMCGEMGPSLLFGIAVMLPLLDILPGEKEIRHRLIAERKQMDTVWFRFI